MAKKLQDIFELESVSSRNDFSLEPMKIGWKPSSTATVEGSQSSTVLDVDRPNGNTALAPLYLTPFFVYDRDQINVPAIEAPPNGSGQICLEEDEDVEEINGNNEGVDSDVMLGLATLWFWW